AGPQATQWCRAHLADDCAYQPEGASGGGRHPKQMISLRLPAEVVARWKATGPGWQTRMAERLAKAPLPRAPGGA
ncbi:MAG: BrnA antitoxin family protein, partial [Gammaproteobacteria bacterium]